jgi:hypothetical protein
MIFAYSGRRSTSLPPNGEAHLKQRLETFLGRGDPSWVVGAAACGADILLLEAAVELRRKRGAPQVAVVLPTSIADFREDSVAPDWRDRFERLMTELDGSGLVTPLGLPPGEEETYRAGNAAILEAATAQRIGDDERIAVLAMASPGDGKMVEDLIAAGRRLGMPAIRLDPEVDIATRPYCFVAMPYGRKFDVQTRRNVDCDELYRKVLVPALENAQLRYDRADERRDAGVILKPMIQDLARADVVIADLGTGNFNVGWELGLRHLLADRTTLLMAPEGARIPFDVQSIRQVHYARGRGGITDGAAIECWDALARFLDPVPLPDPDSPVLALADEVRLATLKIDLDERDPAAKAYATLREGQDRRDPDLVLEAARLAESLPGDRRRRVRGDAGVVLREMGRQREAREILGPLVEEDTKRAHPEWHQAYAMAIYMAEGAGEPEFRQARAVLENLGDEHRETRALLGAVGKRLALLEPDPIMRRPLIEASLRAYEDEFGDDLNAFYPAINVVAVGMVLGQVHGDAAALARAEEVLAIALLGARKNLRRSQHDFWALASVADAAGLEAMMSGDPLDSAKELYAAALAENPPPGHVGSVVRQLHWLKAVGIEHPGLPGLIEWLDGVVARRSAPA